MPDWLRLAVGTFTRLPVPAPRRVDRATARWAMTFAPVIALVLSVICALPLLVASDNLARTLLLSALSLGLLAWCTRALHLDGLADTADALGSGKPPAEALVIARKSDIGPFGVLAIAFNLLLQVFALSAVTATSMGAGRGYLIMIIAVVTGRVALLWACTNKVPAARPDGLGAVVAGTVPLPVTISWTLVLLFAAYFALNLTGLGAAGVGMVIAGIIIGVIAVAIARRRLGGVTGDVLGAVIEASTTTALVVAALF